MILYHFYFIKCAAYYFFFFIASFTLASKSGFFYWLNNYGDNFKNVALAYDSASKSSNILIEIVVLTESPN